jgi:hypothetical protein
MDEGELQPRSKRFLKPDISLITVIFPVDFKQHGFIVDDVRSWELCYFTYFLCSDHLKIQDMHAIMVCNLESGRNKIFDFDAV